MTRLYCCLLLLYSCTLHAAETPHLPVLAIDDAINLALEANHRYLNLMDQTQLSELDYESARSVYRTKFGTSISTDARSGADVGSTYALFLNKRNESGSGYSAGYYNSTFGDDSLSEWRFSYTLPFFKNPLDNNQLAIDQAEFGTARSRRLVEIGREELSNQVVSAYLKLAMATKAEGLAGEKLALAESYFQAQQIRERNGEISLLELTEAELDILDSRQNSEIALFVRRSQQDDFRLLLGMATGTPFAIDEDVLAQAYHDLADRPLPELEQHAIKNRIELLAKREELQLTGKKIESTRVGRFPPVEISLQYALVGEGDGLEDSFKVDDQRFGIGFKMNTDLGNSDARIKQRRLYLQRKTYRRDYEYLERTVAMEVRRAYMDTKRAATNHSYVERYLTLAAKKHEQAEILYQRGDIPELQLLESRHRMTEAKLRALSARVDYLLAEQTLAMASGYQRY